MRKAVFSALLVLGAAGAAPAWAAPALAPGRLEFEVMRSGGKPFGRHVVEVTPIPEGVEVRDVTHYEVKIGPLLLYRYDRTCQERWRGGALASFSCSTREGGRTVEVAGVAGPEGLRVTGPGGGGGYPPGAQHFAPWNLAYAVAPVVIDSETGKPMRGGLRAAPCAAGSEAARCMRVEGSIGGEFRYDAQGRWIGLEFSAKGQHISYRLRSPAAEAPH